MEKFNNFLNPIKKEEKNSSEFEMIQEAELINIEEKDRNADGLLLTPEGEVSHYQNELYWKILKTESFKKWFNGSVVIYEDNKEPLMVFHSTLKKEIKGLGLKPNNQVFDWNSYGVYFSSNKQATVDFYKTQYEDDLSRYEKLLSEDLPDKESVYLDQERYVLENEDKVKTFSAFVKITKPLKLRSHEELMETSWAGFSRQDLLKEYDGVVISQDSEFSDQYVVFETESILHLPSELK